MLRLSEAIKLSGTGGIFIFEQPPHEPASGTPGAAKGKPVEAVPSRSNLLAYLFLPQKATVTSGRQRCLLSLECLLATRGICEGCAFPIESLCISIFATESRGKPGNDVSTSHPT